MKARPAVRIESRAQLVHRIRQELEQRGWPRVQMMLLVMLTGGAGFLASFALLTMGVDSLALRYPLAVGIAYLVFLLLLWLWLRTSPEDYDGLDTAVGEIIEAMPQAAARTANRTIGGGGQFGGGGSTSHWTSSTHSEPLVELPDVPAPNVNLSDADEVAIPLVVVLFVAGLVLTVLFASMSIVFSAPMLFAEMIVDGVLAATLYRRLRRIDTRHWLHSAVRRTAVPFAITAVFVAVGGAALSNYAPGARTLGEVVTMLAQAA